MQGPMKPDHRHATGTTSQQGQNADTSLRGKSLERALNGDVPRTLTPHEWEAWYAEHGVPDAHRRGDRRCGRRWWRFWKRRS
jgi:hypothetical protein